MSQKLTELLEQITPLPWDSESQFPIQVKQFWADEAYRIHAANVLPELVRRLKVIAESPKLVLRAEDMRGIAVEGLRIAEEVKGQQLTP